MTEQIKALENQLGLSLPESYKRFLEENKGCLINGLPIYGVSTNNYDYTVFTATQALHLARPEIPKTYLVIRFLENQALCLDLNRVSNGDCPLIEIEIDSHENPKELGISFGQYVEMASQSEAEINEALRRISNLFRNEIKPYEHNAKNRKVPFKARDWKVIRSCVHDYVTGLSAFRHNEQFNGLEVDAFISTDHPDYEHGHGIKALTLLLLSDAYKNGASMEFRFTRHDHNSQTRVKDKIPHQLVNLFNENGVTLSKKEQSIITHFEAVSLYAHLVGLTTDVIEKIKEYQNEERLSLQGVCFLISSRLWAIDEAKWILFNAPRPEGILFGRDVPEDRLKYEESLSFGRAAVAVSKLRQKLENSIVNEGDTTAQIENQLFHIISHQAAELDWSITTPNVQLNEGEEITVLSRPRRFFPQMNQLIEDDLKPLLSSLKNANKKFLLYSEDFMEVKNYKKLAQEVKKQNNIEILVLPFTTNELDNEVNKRMRKAKVIRT